MTNIEKKLNELGYALWNEEEDDLGLKKTYRLVENALYLKVVVEFNKQCRPLFYVAVEDNLKFSGDEPWWRKIVEDKFNFHIEQCRTAFSLWEILVGVKDPWEEAE